MTIETIWWGRRFNLSDAKIYKLVNKVDDAVYVGSTCIMLEERLQWHQHCAVEKPAVKVYKHFNAIGWEHVRIELIEECSCTSYDELLQREDHWIRALKSKTSLNTNHARLTDSERLGYQKSYREKHREKRLEYGKKYRKCMRAKTMYVDTISDMPLLERKRLLDNGAMKKTKDMQLSEFKDAR